MGLQSTIQNAVKSIFTAVDDIALTATYTINANSSYNPTTGTVTQSGTQQSIKVIRDTYSIYEKTNATVTGKDGSLKHAVLETDIKFLTPVIDFIGTPTTKDTITVDSITYNVIGLPEKDPANAMYVIQARKP